MRRLLFIAIIAAAASALTPQEAYISGNEAYKAGDYNEAMTLYRQAIDGGLMHPFVYYNLGNAALKSDSIAKAILAYERAYFLDPRDPEIKKNLDFARAHTPDKIKSLYRGTFLGRFWRTMRIVSFGELIYAFIILSALATILSGLYLIAGSENKRRTLLKWSLIIWALTALTFALYAGRLSDDWTLRKGVILASSVDVMSAPTEDGELLFTIHGGTEVAVKEQIGDHDRIVLEDGRIGWIPADAVERVLQK